jgi:Uma2 family endonuclease
MGMPALPTTGWTVDMLETLPDDGNRYEIIDGELLVTPAPRRSHQRAVRRLLILLDSYLRSRPDLEALTSPADIRAGHRTSVQPDVFVAPIEPGQEAQRWPQVRALLLAVEVLSSGTARVDRQKKRRLYQDEKVAEYWIVDLDSRLVERWRPGDERPEILTQTLEWRPAGMDQPLRIDLDEFFNEVAGAE